MPRRHPRTYRKRKAASPSSEQEHWPGATDYRPLVAVIGLVIFGLAAIAFLLTLRSHG